MILHACVVCVFKESAFSVGVMDGKIVLTSTQDGGTVKLMSHVNTYSDGNWHYVSIMKDGLMLVDIFSCIALVLHTGFCFLLLTVQLLMELAPGGETACHILR